MFEKKAFDTMKVLGWVSLQHVFGCLDCVTTKFPQVIMYVKYLAIWMPILATSGFMYIRVILTLKAGAQNNARKRQLTTAFFALWFSWVFLTSPYALFEFCAMFIPSFQSPNDSFDGIGTNIYQYFKTSFPLAVPIIDRLQIFF